MSNFSITCQWRPTHRRHAESAFFPEDEATTGLLKISVGDSALTRMRRISGTAVREGPVLSAVCMAQWLLWNWWRIVWEPKRSTNQWRQAHHMRCIGDGWIWPDIMFEPESNGVRLIASPTKGSLTEPISYCADESHLVDRSEFLCATDGFFVDVMQRLSTVLESQFLTYMHHRLLAERADPDIAMRRRIEAVLGFGPAGTAPVAVIRKTAQQAKALGWHAAQSPEPGGAWSLPVLLDMAVQNGLRPTEAEDSPDGFD